MLYVIFILLFVVILTWMIIRAYSKKKDRLHKEHIESIARILPLVETAFSDLRLFYNYNHFITEREVFRPVQTGISHSLLQRIG